jgi:cold shock protein
MGRYKSHREPRRRGFDDDNYSSRDRHSQPERSSHPSPGTSSSPATTAVVSWFNADKGFGFVKASDGSDAFLHVRALEAAGHNSVPPGATLKVRLGAGLKGPQVMEVMEVDLSTVQAQAPTLSRSPRGQSQPEGEVIQGQGTVKWFNGEKGFGFIGLDGGGKDVFVHAAVVNRSGLTTLNEGQKVWIEYAMGKKGLEAKSVRTTD